jgi:hypothetical protein
MRRILLATTALAAMGGVASADSFGGFSGVQSLYLVAPDKVCTPLKVDAAAATGTPKCEKAAADAVAELSIKTPTAEKGAKARFAATASGRTVTVKAGDRDVVLVTWTSFDPIARVAAVYGSQYGDMIAVEVVVRRSGRETTDVVGFDLGKDHATTEPAGTGTGTGTGTGIGPTAGTDPAPAADKAMTTALKKARSASGAKAIAAWTKVLDLDPNSSEALLGLAAAQLKTKKKDEALATLEKLAASTRADAIEYRVAARFDKAFASVRSDPRFRAAVGLDKPGGTLYERVMGQGGKWEQTLTCGQNPHVVLTLAKDHKFKLLVESKCGGDDYGWTFKGTWKVDAQNLLLTFPNSAKRGDEQAACTVATQGDEDAITCPVDDDLQFTVLPVRR